MEMSDMLNDKYRDGPPDTRTDFMNMRKFQPRDGLKEKLLSAQANEAAVDNLIRGIVDLLPKCDGIWSLDDRAKWLRLAAGIFDLGYKSDEGEQREISIAVVKPKLPPG
jgi:hypothetical protein